MVDFYNPRKYYSIVRDWNLAQGMTHPSDEHVQIRRDLNIRRVSIENSSTRQIGIAIVPYPSDPIPDIQYVLAGGEVKNLGINTVDGPMQFLHLLDPITKERVGSTGCFRTDCQSFVLRDGLQKWYIHYFKSAGFKG
jgi:hypothetical protein